MPSENTKSQLPPKSPKPTSKIATMPETLDVALHAMNEEVVYVRDRSMIAEISPRRTSDHTIPLITCAAFKNEAYCDRRVKIGDSHVPIAARWMTWKERRVVNRIVYRPGEPRFTADGNLNVWFPSPSIPREGDVSIFLTYMRGLMRNDIQYLDWIIAWCAFHLQHPDKKMLTAVMIWSHQQGNGKSTLGWILEKIYAHNCGFVRTAFPERFNSYAENKGLVWVDELRPMRETKQIDIVKTSITQQQILIENKLQRPYVMEDRISYFMTSNYPNALDLHPEDRRFFVHNAFDTGLTPAWFESTLYPYLHQQSSIDAIHHFLLNVDLTKPIVGGNPNSHIPAPFNHLAPAPKNEARRQMIADNRDDVEAWLDDLTDNPEIVLGISRAEETIFTSEELFDLYKQSGGDGKQGIQAFRNRMSGRLLPLCSGHPIRLGEGSRKRLYTSDKAKALWDTAHVRDTWAHEREKSCATKK